MTAAVTTTYGRVPRATGLTADASVKAPILAERFKTKMCQNYEKFGACAYEARCMFAHGEADLRTKEMNIKDGLTTDRAIKVWLAAQGYSGSPIVTMASGEVRTGIVAERFKTKSCANFERDGECVYAARCMFAHGAADLRTPEQNVAEGLVDEEVVRAFQAAEIERVRAERRRETKRDKRKRRQENKRVAAESGNLPGCSSDEDATDGEPESPAAPEPPKELQLSISRDYLASESMSPAVVTTARRYRHDPYSLPAIGWSSKCARPTTPWGSLRSAGSEASLGSRPATPAATRADIVEAVSPSTPFRSVASTQSLKAVHGACTCLTCTRHTPLAALFALRRRQAAAPSEAPSAAAPHTVLMP
jgi:hypothetical protein